MEIHRPTVVALGSVPKDGGTFTFYRNIRPPLRDRGVDLRCVSVGSREGALWDPGFADEGCVLLAKDEGDVKKQAMAFADWSMASGVGFVMGINSLPILSALPHLAQHIRVMSRCANAFDHGYNITLSCHERLARIIATTPRLKHDLVKSYSVDERRINLIPNGISPEAFKEATLHFEVGEEIELSKTMKQLAHSGYQRVDMVEMKGDFALRGGILDLYPLSHDTPVRIELFLYLSSTVLPRLVQKVE